MKKKATLLLVLLICSAFLTGCGEAESSTQTDYLSVYSFSGENEQFAISNGVVVLTETEEYFYGGTLEINQESFSNIASCSMTFYISSGDEKTVVLSNSVENMSGGAVSIAGDIGKISGDGIITEAMIDGHQPLQNNLLFELTTVDLNGEEIVYQVPLSLTEITDTVTQ